VGDGFRQGDLPLHQGTVHTGRQVALKTDFGQGGRAVASIHQAETDEDRALIRELFWEYLDRGTG
jgi:hypothetical protein